MSDKEFNPLASLMPGEEFLALMGRSRLSPPLLRLYALTLENKRERGHALLDAIFNARADRPNQPDDGRKAWAARAMADRMEAWRHQTIDARGVPQRINSAPDRDVVTVQESRQNYDNLEKHDAGALGNEAVILEIKSAAPSREPDEAS